MLCGYRIGKCAILSNNGLLLILIDPYYLSNIDNKTQFKFDTLLNFYWPMAGTRLPRRSLIGRAIKYRRRESQLTACYMFKLYSYNQIQCHWLELFFVSDEKNTKHYFRSVSCYRVRFGVWRGNKISIKRQIKFWNEKSGASQSVGVRHLLIGLWHFWFLYDFATRLDTQK